MKMDKKSKITIGVLAAVVVILSGFIVYSLSVGWMVSQQQAAYNVGIQDGYTQAVVDVVTNSRNCQTGVPLTVGNNTYTLIDVDCQWVQNCLQAASSTTG